MDFDDAITPTGDIFKYKTTMNVGDVFQGVLQGKPEISPHTNFKTKLQEVTANGKPKWQLKVIVAVNGENKTVFLQGSAYYAALQAFREAKLDEYRGAAFGLKRDEDTESETAGFSPRKNYTVKVAAPKEG